MNTTVMNRNTRGFDRGPWELSVGGLQLLQAHDVRLGLRQPGEKIGQPAIDVIDVEGGDLHGVRRATQAPTELAMVSR